jgi:hypothetical protein
MMILESAVLCSIDSLDRRSHQRRLQELAMAHRYLSCDPFSQFSKYVCSGHQHGHANTVLKPLQGYHTWDGHTTFFTGQ